MNTNGFTTKLIKQHAHTKARITKITTPHGEFLTPAFMPVGTKAYVNCLTSNDLLSTGSKIILGGNTYHMLISPGMDIIQANGGMHEFMNWHKPMLTDSGGFQVFSLSKNSNICKIKKDGAHFKHPTTGKIIQLTPTTSLATQKIIGADIIMAFDECTPETGGRKAAIAAMERTHRWLIESKEAHLKNPLSAYGYKQALFAIIQGGSFRDLREKSTKFILNMELDGVGIGGESIGFDMQKTCDIIDWIEPILPQNKTRYTMGVGLHPQDILDVVARGIDIFDCVAPTRNARHGSLFCGDFIKTKDNWLKFASEEDRGRILIKKSKYAKDNNPISPGCDCFTCKNYTRAYLHYLFKEKLQLYTNLATIHNIRTMHRACEAIYNLINTTS
jgi:queuine tRNA-ribosyltransferase